MGMVLFHVSMKFIGFALPLYFSVHLNNFVVYFFVKKIITFQTFYFSKEKPTKLTIVFDNKKIEIIIL